MAIPQAAVKPKWSDSNSQQVLRNHLRSSIGAASAMSRVGNRHTYYGGYRDQLFGSPHAAGRDRCDPPGHPDLGYADFGHLNVAFLVAYAAMYMGGGKLIDTLGTRRGFFVIMVFWSLACASHGLAMGFWMLAISRFLSGLGEGGGFPAATKAVAEWFPRSRAFQCDGADQRRHGGRFGRRASPDRGDNSRSSVGDGCFFWQGGWARVDGMVAVGLFSRRRSIRGFQPRNATKAEAELIGRNCAAGECRPIVVAALGCGQCGGWSSQSFSATRAWFFYSSWLPKYLLDVHEFRHEASGLLSPGFRMPPRASEVSSVAHSRVGSCTAAFSLGLSRKLALGAARP